MMKQSLFFIFIFFALSVNASEFQSITLLENEDIKLTLLHKEGSVIQNDWLQLALSNIGTKQLTLKSLFYRFESDCIMWEEESSCSLGQGNKFDIFSFYEKLENPSRFDLVLAPNETQSGGRAVSNYANVLMNSYEKHFNRKNTNATYPLDESFKINAEIKIQISYYIDDVLFEEEHVKANLPLNWFPTKDSDKAIIASQFISAMDSLEVRGNSWLVSHFIKDQEIIDQVPMSHFIDLVKTEKRNKGQFDKFVFDIIKSKGAHEDLVQHYLSALKKPKFTVLRELDHFWDDRLLEPLYQSFLTQNENHYQYMKLFSNHYHLWESDERMKNTLYKIVKDYAYQVLTPYNKMKQSSYSGWSSWINILAQSHSNKAINYIKPFLKNKELLYGDRDISHRMSSMGMHHPCPKRICDFALEAIFIAQNKDIAKQYDETLKELMNAGIIKEIKQDPEAIFIQRINYLTKDNNIELIRDHLIQQLL